VKSLVIRTGVKPEGKKYLPGLSRYLGNIRDSLTGSDRVRPIPGSFPPDLGLTSLGYQNRKGYLKTSSDASFHTFRLSFCQSSCRVVNRRNSGLRVVFVLELLRSGLVYGLAGGSCLVPEDSMTKARTTSPLTRNQKKKMSEVPSEVKLRKIVPKVSRDEAERGELLEDLQVMGYSGFLEKPWGFKDNRIVRELLDGVSNEFDNSI
jgi:hypothetical protein